MNGAERPVFSISFSAIFLIYCSIMDFIPGKFINPHPREKEKTDMPDGLKKGGFQARKGGRREPEQEEEEINQGKRMEKWENGDILLLSHTTRNPPASPLSLTSTGMKRKA